MLAAYTELLLQTYLKHLLAALSLVLWKLMELLGTLPAQTTMATASHCSTRLKLGPLQIGCMKFLKRNRNTYPACLILSRYYTQCTQYPASPCQFFNIATLPDVDIEWAAQTQDNTCDEHAEIINATAVTIHFSDTV